MHPATVTTLRRAKRRLTPETWAKGDPSLRPAGTLCALDALRAAYDTCPVQVQVHGLWVDSYMALVNAAGFPTVAAFNDDPDTTHADVLALYDRAIEIAKQDA